MLGSDFELVEHILLCWVVVTHDFMVSCRRMMFRFVCPGYFLSKYSSIHGGMFRDLSDGCIPVCVQLLLSNCAYTVFKLAQLV